MIKIWLKAIVKKVIVLTDKLCRNMGSIYMTEKKNSKSVKSFSACLKTGHNKGIKYALETKTKNFSAMLRFSNYVFFCF